MKEHLAALDSSAMEIILNAEKQIQEITGHEVALVAYNTILQLKHL